MQESIDKDLSDHTPMMQHHGRMGVEIFYCTHGVKSGSLMLNVV